MELLDRYLEAIRKHLPWKRQDDILAELRANFEAQLEDREAELGRPLTQVETEDWLRELGSPLRVAARYQPQQYLIGPSLFPIYWMMLKIVLLWVAIIYCISNAVLLATERLSWHALPHLAVSLPFSLLWSAGVITLIFAAIELVSVHFPEKLSKVGALHNEWSPASLPPLPKPQKDGKRRSYAKAVTEVVAQSIFLSIWLIMPHYPVILLGPAAFAVQASPITYAPVLAQFYWSVAAFSFIEVFWKAVKLARGTWQEKGQVQRIVLAVLGLAPTLLMVSAPGRIYFLLKQSGALPPGLSLDVLNQGIYKISVFILVITLLQLAWEVGRYLLNRQHQRAAAL
ncbi:MAG: hypothetical protein ABSF70_01025 [Terracidiphilus sp.]|jgi:hypothetical protein